MNPLFTILAQFIPDLLNRILPPEKMTEAEKQQAIAQAQSQLLNADWDKIEAEYKDRADARNLASQDIAKGNAFTSFLSATVRPLWGYGALCVVGYNVVHGMDIPPGTRDIIDTVLYFYFGGRTLEKVVPHIAQAVSNIGGKN